jgi:hypothetical protein
MRSTVLAACFFLVSLFAMTNILMMTTEGFPLKVVQSDFMRSSVLGGTSLLLGIMSLIGMIALAGWTKSKSMGRFTTTVGIITLILILIMLV